MLGVAPFPYRLRHVCGRGVRRLASGRQVAGVYSGGGLADGTLLVLATPGLRPSHLGEERVSSQLNKLEEREATNTKVDM